MSEQSGSRGEANFVWKCKNCKVRVPYPSICHSNMLNLCVFAAQRESSATIKAAPQKYEQNSPAKAKNIIEIDCRGLEFTDFKPDVCSRPVYVGARLI